MEKQKITAEFAELEIGRFADAMDLDLDPKGMDDEDRKSLTSAKRRLTRALLAGSLVVNDDGQPVFTTSDGKTVTFKETKGAALISMDQRKKDHDIERMFTFMGESTEEDRALFANMQSRDIKVCIAIASLFLG